jgi:DUF4097 and DUF4098 domain-containing protein YvlB
MEYTFDTPQPVRLRVEINSGELRLEATETTTTTVLLEPMRDSSGAQRLIEEIRVEHQGDEISVIFPKFRGGLFGSKAEVRATVTVPRDSSARVRSGSADVLGAGHFGEIDVLAGSGDVAFEETASAKIQTGSGDVDVKTIDGVLDAKAGSGDVVCGSVVGAARITTGSGDILVRRSDGEVNIKAGSGDVIITEAGESVDAMTGSGDLVVERLVHGRLKAKTGSGDVQVGVPDGTAAYLDVMSISGSVRSELEASDTPDGGPTTEVAVMTASGDIVLKRV